MRKIKILSLFITIALLAGCSTNPSTGRRQFILFSADEVAAMGEEAKPELVKEFGGEVASQPLRAYVREVGEKLAKRTEPEYRDVQWEFITLDSDVINAFALPGGKVFITRGLLGRFDNEAQIAGVLGHEIGHVTARHTDERLSQAWSAQIGLEVLGRSTESQIANLGANLLVSGALLKFNRSQESESDRQGLKYMTAAGYDPHGMLEVIEVLLEASQGGGTPEILSTHPHPESRLEDVQNRLSGEYQHTQNNPKFRKFRSRFRREAVPHLQGGS